MYPRKRGEDPFAGPVVSVPGFSAKFSEALEVVVGSNCALLQDQDFWGTRRAGGMHHNIWILSRPFPRLGVGIWLDGLVLEEEVQIGKNELSHRPAVKNSSCGVRHLLGCHEDVALKLLQKRDLDLEAVARRAVEHLISSVFSGRL